MPDNNIAILSLVSKFDEKSARKAAEQANTTYENAMKKLGDTKFADASVDEFNKALKAIDGKLKGVKLSSYQNDVLESLFSDKTVAEKTQSIENFTKKIFALNKALSGLPANSFDGLSTKQLDVIIGRQEKIIEKQDEIERKEATVRAKANRTAKTERDYGSIEKKYGNKDYTEMSKSVQSALKGQKDFTKEQLASIDNFSKILNLYSQMESIQPEKGTEEAISYTRDLLTVTKELKKARDEVNSFTDNKASAYISKNYAGVNKVDNQSLYTAKTNFVNRELSSLNSQKAKMERELNTYIGETVQKNIEKRVSDTENVINVVEKKTNDLNQRIENLNKNSKNLKNTTDDLSNANQQLDNVGSQNSDDLRLMNQALEEIRDTYKDVAKYAVDAETAFSNLQSLMKTLQKKGGLDESEQKDFLGYATRLDSLKNNEIVPDDSYSFKGDKLEDFESYYDRYLDKYNKLALRITDMTDDQIDAFNDLKKNNVNSISAQTSELKHQEIQAQKTAEAEKELKSVESENHINDNPKNVSLVVESEQALQNIKSVKENLDNLPENKTIKITVENNDYSSTPLLSDEEGKIVTAYRGVKGVWSGLINDKDIAFFTDKIENAADYADSLAESGKVYKANLSFKNPLEVDGNGAVWDKLKVNLDGVERTTDQIVELARTLGKDCVIFKNIKDGFGEHNGGISNVMVALNRAQIKNEEVVAAVKAGSGEMTRIVNSDTTTSTVVGSQNEIQEELKETQNQAEKTTQALEKVNDATLLSSKTNLSSESSSMEQVQKSTDQAVQAKEDFAKANTGVQTSVDESKSSLKLEAELMEQIAKSAKKAADKKDLFVKANERVKKATEESNPGLKLESATMEDIAENTQAATKAKKASSKKETDSTKKVKSSDTSDNDNTILNASPDLYEEYNKRFNPEKLRAFKSELDAINQKIAENDVLIENCKSEIDDLNNGAYDFISSPSFVSSSKDQFEKRLVDLEDENETLLEQAKRVKTALEEEIKLSNEAYSKAKSVINNADNTGIENDQERLVKRTEAYKKLTDTIDQYNNVSKRVISMKAQEGDYNLMYKLRTEIEELSSNPILSDKHVADAKEKVSQVEITLQSLEKIFKSTRENVIKKIEDQIQGFNINGFSTADFDSIYGSRIKTLTSQFEEGSISLNKYNTECNKIFNSFSKVVNSGTKVAGSVKNVNEAVQLMNDNSKSYGTIIDQGVANTNKGITVLTNTVRTSEGEVLKLKYTYVDGMVSMANATKNVRTQLTGIPKFIDAFKSKFKELVVYYAANNFNPQSLARPIMAAARNVIALNSNIVDLAKVSEENVSQLYHRFNEFSDIAKDIGGTISDTISATDDWSKNGYNIPDSEELAKVALIYKNVGDGIDISTANESLISTLKGFNLEAKDAMHIIDVFNEVSNNEPISSAGIGEALQQSAASLNAANTSLEKSVALVTATNSVLQDTSRTGNMWKTVSARLRGADAELKAMGEDTEGMVTSTSKLRDLVMGMTGFDIMKDKDTFKDVYDIVLGIGEKWQDLSDVNRASLLEKLAGVTKLFARIYRNINYRIYLIARVA